MSKYKHREAYCLMIYRCENCGHIERIWNSRDGVTPFGTACPSCAGNVMYHLFGSDQCMPEHKLNKFQKFWRDGLPHEAERILRRRHALVQKTKYRIDKSEDCFVEDVLKDGGEFPEGWPMLDIRTGESK